MPADSSEMLKCCMQNAISLMCRRAWKLQPRNAAYALNYMHTLELEQALNKALSLAAAFLRKVRSAANTCRPRNPEAGH